MLVSRGLTILKTARILQKNQSQALQQVRNSSHQWSYRSNSHPPSQNLINIAIGVAGFAWWWVLWHLWTEPGHIVGEFDYPDPRKWTDEELGIPPE